MAKKKPNRKKSTKKRRKPKPSSVKGKEVLYLHISPKTKAWLRALCKKQSSKFGHTSLSAMAAVIFEAAKSHPKLIKAARG
jgi:hypothetical protein